MTDHTLAASAARTTSDSGPAVLLGGYWRRMMAVLDVTASAAVAGDTLAVFIDVSHDGILWLNACQFTTQAGDDPARTEFCVLDASDPGTATIDATADAAPGMVRPALFGKWARARWAIVDGGAHGQSHTFSVTVTVQ